MSSKKQRGASLIEFALVLPVFLTLIMGILFYGIAFATQQAVHFAAERGAEAAVSVDPDVLLIDSEQNVNSLVSQLASDRIRGVLGCFPGVDEVLPESGAGVVAIRVAEESACGDDEEGGTAVKICVVDDGADTRHIQVRLSLAFDQLWLGFPRPGFFLTPDVVQATGSAVLAGASDAAGSG